jgi:signal peptidase II
MLSVALAIVALDQWSKSLVRHHFLGQGGEPIPLLGGVVQINYVENRGAAFGLFQNQTTFFVLVGLVVVIAILLSYRHLPRGSPLLYLCLGLQLGGAVGNLIDRVRFGHVVDFIDLRFWPVFNVADSAITVGVAALIYQLLLASPRAGAEDRAS